MKPLKQENLPLYSVEKAEVSLMEGQVLQRLAIPFERNCNLFFFKRVAFPFLNGNATLFCFRDFGECFQDLGKGVLMDMMNRWMGPIKQKAEVKSKRHSGSASGSHVW